MSTQPQPASNPPAPSGLSPNAAAMTGVAIAGGMTLAQVFGALNPADSASVQQWRLATRSLIGQHAHAAAALAARHYMAARRAAGITEAFTPKLQLPTVAQIDSTIDWTLGTLYAKPTAPAASPLVSPRTSPVITVRLPEAKYNTDDALRNLQTGAERITLNAGRDTTAEAATKDRKARGYARETEPGACWWCAMLATRGGIYRTAETAGEGRKFHNNCRCQIVPVFGAYEPPADVRKWQDMWAEATRGVSGMKNMQQAWKQAFLDREVKPNPNMARQAPTHDTQTGLPLAKRAGSDRAPGQSKIAAGVTRLSGKESAQIKSFSDANLDKAIARLRNRVDHQSRLNPAQRDRNFSTLQRLLDEAKAEKSRRTAGN